MKSETEYHNRRNRTPQRSKIVRAALLYAGRGIPVFPLHSVDASGRCSCRKPGCEDAGKHPRVKGGFHAATTDKSRITAWGNRWPDANLGIPTGERSGILALDVDQPPSLDELEAEHGKLPKTRAHSTGSGGMHYLFKYPAGVEIRNSTGKLGFGLDVRGEGGYIVAPPSATTRPYEVLDDLPLAGPPEWLLVALRAPEKAVPGERRAAAPIFLDRAGEVIAVGTRNRTLTSIAGRLHDGTRDRAGIEAELLEINRRRCAEPLPEAEVRAIARWVFEKPSCKPAAKQDPQVEEVLEAAGRYWYARLLPGGGKSKLRDVYRALIGFGGKHGELTTVRIAGEEHRAVRFSASCRQVAPEAGTTPMSVSRNTKRLRQNGAIRKDDAGRHDADGGTFLIIEPAPQRYTPNNPSPSGSERGVGEGCNTTARPPRPDKLWTPASRWGDHVGNARAGTLYALEAFGPQTRAELAKRLGYARPRDFERRHLEPLARLGLVEERGGIWALPRNYRVRTAALRGVPYSTVRCVRRRHHSPEGRLVTEVVEVGAVASVEDRDGRDRERYAKETVAFRERHRHPADRADKTSEMDCRRDAHRADGEIRELQRALAADPELVEVLRAFLARNPHRRGEYPSWLATALWAENLMPRKPLPAAVELALSELRSVA